MLKVPYKKLRLKCKGSLNNSNYKLCLARISKRIVQGIPVLSIFVLLGICSYAIGLHYPIEEVAHNLSGGLLFSNITGDNKAYAAETGTSASLIVDDGIINDKVDAAYNNFAYASHKVTIEASNIKSYTLTLTPNQTLTGPSAVTGAGGKTPAQMTGTSSYWGYAWTDTTASPTTAAYNTLDTVKTLTGPAVNATSHSVGGSKQLIFGVKFGDSAVSGTYSAKATLSMVATPYTVVNYSITYNTNGGSAMASTTVSDESGASSKTLTISSTKPTLSNYSFRGWATSSNGGAVYQPGDTVTLQASYPTITLYAVWQQVVPWGSMTTMQQMTSEACAGATVGATATLTDTRDGSTYTVKKLNSSQCWMTQNLGLVDREIFSTDSDMTTTYSYTIPASTASNGGFNDSTSPFVYYSNNTTYGAYYSRCAAMAGECTETFGTGSNATSSICPKGWHLPVGGTGTTGVNTGAATDTKNDFMAMAGKTVIDQYKDESLVSGTNMVLGGTTWPFAGYRYGNSFGNGGSWGMYWSRTAYSGTTMYVFRVYNTGSVQLSTTGSGGNHYGYSIRCVAYAN